jgi:hypothetical protein
MYFGHEFLSGHRVAFDQSHIIKSKSTRMMEHCTFESLPFPPPSQVTMSIELVVTAPSPTVATDPSTSEYNATFGRASNDFEKLMAQDDHKPTDFESAKAVLEVLGETVKLFDADGFRAGNQSLTTWLKSYVDLLFTVSATLWESTQAVSLTHYSLLSCYCTLTSFPPASESLARENDL